MQYSNISNEGVQLIVCINNWQLDWQSLDFSVISFVVFSYKFQNISKIYVHAGCFLREGYSMAEPPTQNSLLWTADKY